MEGETDPADENGHDMPERIETASQAHLHYGIPPKRPLPVDDEEPSSALHNDRDGLAQATKRARRLSAASNSSAAETISPRIQGRHKTAQLPPEIWQLIFSFLDPVCLGRLLRVDRKFHALLNPKKKLPSAISSQGQSSLKPQDLVWSTSRKTYYPGFPRPLAGMTELEMWSLIQGSKCQFCDKPQQHTRAPIQHNPWNAGPGPEDVRIIWPFRIRTCSNCLGPQLIKDTELLLSSDSTFMCGLPSAFFTPSLNFVSSVTLRQNSTPPGLHLTKYFSRPDVERIKNTFEEIRGFGPAAAEEWLKGLSYAGQEKTADASRFEQWEANGGLYSLGADTGLSATPGRSTLSTQSVNGALPSQQLPRSTASGVVFGSRTHQAPNFPTLPQFALGKDLSSGHWLVTSCHPPPPRVPVTPLTDSLGSLPHLPLQPISPAPGQEASHTFARSWSPATTIQPRPSHSRMGRNPQDVDQRKAEKRADIERRCLELDPPILPSTLMYMESFGVAMQIPMALNENSWDLLKSRLLSQRSEAEAKEEEAGATNIRLRADLEQRQPQDDQYMLSKHAPDREWDLSQQPLREKLAQYVDEYIMTNWDGGTAVTMGNAPQFAADVLLHVKSRYAQAIGDGESLPSPSETLSSRQTSTDGSSKNLKLEHMKWVYDFKIKHITERFRKDLFLCHACDLNKYFALDAVIQHYAAKHTNILSHGTAVVYWKADWPDDPPFEPQPLTKFSSRRSEYFAGGTSPLYSESGWPSRSVMNHVGLQQIIQPIQNYSISSPNEVMRTPIHIQSALTSPIISNSQRPPYGAQTHQPSRVPPGFNRGFGNLTQPRTGRKEFQYDLTSQNPQYLFDHQQPMMMQPSNIYEAQVQELARNARDVWQRTDGIRNLPSSIRVQVTINHVVRQFSDKFKVEPSLNLLGDALNTAVLKPVKEVSGLTCKACSLFPNGKVETGGIEIVYTLFDLLKHFQANHIEFRQARIIPHTDVIEPQRDWKADMIQLPDPTIVQGLMHAPGMTSPKWNLITGVLPEYFPYAAGDLGRSSEHQVYPNGGINEGIEPTQQPRYHNNERDIDIDAQLDHSRTTTHRDNYYAIRRPLAYEAVTNDEYDPHHPTPTYMSPAVYKHTNYYPPETESQLLRPSLRRTYHVNGYENDHPYLIGSQPSHRASRQYDQYPEEPALQARQHSTYEHLIPSPHRAPSVRGTPSTQTLNEREMMVPRPITNRDELPGTPATAQDPLKHEEHSVQDDSRTEAEQFLDNFGDVPTQPQQDQDSPPSANISRLDVLDNISHHAVIDSIADGPRKASASARNTPGRLQAGRSARENSDDPNDSILTPQELHDAYHLRRQGSQLYAIRDHNDVSYDEVRQDQREARRSTRRVIEYDENGLPISSPELAFRARADEEYHRNQGPIRPQYHEQRISYRPPSPRFHRPQPPAVRARIIELMPSGERRYVEEGRYLDDVHEPVEYVRVERREIAPRSRRYYVEQGTRGQPHEYVGYAGPPEREVVFERDGQLYRRAAAVDQHYDPHGSVGRF